MFKIISKNHANGKTITIRGLKIDSRVKADRMVVRLTMAESNPRVTYTVATA